MKSLLFVSAASLLATASPALAQAQAAAPKNISRADYLKAIDSRFGAIDANHDGVVTKAELAAIEAQVAQQLTTARNQKMRDEFNKLDTNKDGKISADEFRAPEIAKFSKVDANHDGIVTPAEVQAAAGRK